MRAFEIFSSSSFGKLPGYDLLDGLLPRLPQMFSFFKKSSMLDPRFFLPRCSSSLLAFARPVLKASPGVARVFLDESMQCHQAIVVEAKSTRAPSACWEIRPHFPQALIHRAAQWHADLANATTPAKRSVPMAHRSTTSNPFSHSRTGSGAGIVAKDKLGLSWCFFRNQGSSAFL